MCVECKKNQRAELEIHHRKVGIVSAIAIHETCEGWLIRSWKMRCRVEDESLRNFDFVFEDQVWS